MKLPAFIALLLLLAVSSVTLNTSYASPEKISVTKLQEQQDQEEEQKPSIQESISMEAVFQAFHFVPKILVLGMLELSDGPSFPKVAREFEVRDFSVPLQHILFQFIIARNAP